MYRLLINRSTPTEEVFKLLGPLPNLVKSMLSMFNMNAFGESSVLLSDYFYPPGPVLHVCLLQVAKRAVTQSLHQALEPGRTLTYRCQQEMSVQSMEFRNKPAHNAF